MRFATMALLAFLAFGVTACAEGPPRRHVLAFIEIGVRPPPPRVVVVPPPRRGYVWAPGYWRWDGRKHVWVDGRWLRARRGWHWAPTRWEQLGNGRWRFDEGHWER